MSQEQSDEEDSVVETAVDPVDDGTAETEVNFRLPRGSDSGQDRVLKDVPIIMGAIGVEADTLDLGQKRRLGPLSGARPKLPAYELPIQQTGTQPVTDRFAYELPTLQTLPTQTYPGPGIAAGYQDTAGARPVNG